MVDESGGLAISLTGLVLGRKGTRFIDVHPWRMAESDDVGDDQAESTTEANSACLPAVHQLFRPRC